MGGCGGRSPPAFAGRPKAAPPGKPKAFQVNKMLPALGLLYPNLAYGPKMSIFHLSWEKISLEKNFFPKNFFSKNFFQKKSRKTQCGGV